MRRFSQPAFAFAFAYALVLALAGVILTACGQNPSQAVAVDKYTFQFVPPFNISNNVAPGGSEETLLDTGFPAQNSDIQVWLQAEFADNLVVRSHGWSIWGALTSLTEYPIQNPQRTALGVGLLPRLYDVVFKL